MEGNPLSTAYQQWAKPWLFRQEPEAIHRQTLNVLAAAGRSPVLCDLLQDLFPVGQVPSRLFGLSFPNPIGLAAGMDKNGIAIPAWEALGFGFAEVGGATRYPQPGNPKPRLFRAPETEAIVNRMGFNNEGAETLSRNIAQVKQRLRHPLGINLGKSKRTPLEEAHEDFLFSLQTLWHQGDFFVVNVSSPNTPGLRKLQEKSALETILKALTQANDHLSQANQCSTKPLLIKIAPDLAWPAIDDVLTLTTDYRLAGIVATNTTSSRPHSEASSPPACYQETGGLSGKPLRSMSTEVIRYIAKQTKGRLPIIGVGGIDDAESAWEKLAAGASLCQIYSGLIFKGPTVVGSIVAGLARQIKLHGFNTLQDVVGTQCPFQPNQGGPPDQTS